MAGNKSLIQEFLPKLQFQIAAHIFSALLKLHSWFARWKASASTSSTPMRVSGTGVSGCLCVRFTFSPNANLMNGSAPLNLIPSSSAPHLSLINCAWPPIVFAEPCNICEVVTPPLNYLVQNINIFRVHIIASVNLSEVY